MSDSFRPGGDRIRSPRRRSAPVPELPLPEASAVKVGDGGSGGKGKVGAGSAQTLITLRVGSGVVRLSAAISALIAVYPRLAPVVGSAELLPVERLKKLMQGFGLRVRAEQRDPAVGAAAAEVAWCDQVLPLITDDADATPAYLVDILASLSASGANLSLEALRPVGIHIRAHRYPEAAA